MFTSTNFLEHPRDCVVDGLKNESNSRCYTKTAVPVPLASKMSTAAAMRQNLPNNLQVGATTQQKGDRIFNIPEKKDLTSFAAHVLVDTETLETWQKETRSVKPLVEKFEAWTASQNKKYGRNCKKSSSS